MSTPYFDIRSEIIEKDDDFNEMSRTQQREYFFRIV